jgi:hypothetical protein
MPKLSQISAVRTWNPSARPLRALVPLSSMIHVSTPSSAIHKAVTSLTMQVSTSLVLFPFFFFLVLDIVLPHWASTNNQHIDLSFI